MIFSHSNHSIILHILIFTFIAFAQGSAADVKTKVKTKTKSDEYTTVPTYPTPADSAANPTATSAKYTVTITSGASISTPVFDGCCFLDPPQNGCGRDTSQCKGAWIVKRKGSAQSAAQRSAMSIFWLGIMCGAGLFGGMALMLL
ncbi:hypothetical protein SBOR_9435 [Sclerotinia borealis F-4128]|uniref:Uncharacterized protein n=1 Tax=Sclerotinia borealis (strain F-4128) TaxID=1432307 RepID=W9C021_SCLBF|nr:hypothetical protein SBOR_9435 [Sclerotinia borealis F-4128]